MRYNTSIENEIEEWLLEEKTHKLKNKFIKSEHRKFLNNLNKYRLELKLSFKKLMSKRKEKNSNVNVESIEKATKIG